MVAAAGVAVAPRRGSGGNGGGGGGDPSRHEEEHDDDHIAMIMTSNSGSTTATFVGTTTKTMRMMIGSSSTTELFFVDEKNTATSKSNRYRYRSGRSRCRHQGSTRKAVVDVAPPRPRGVGTQAYRSHTSTPSCSKTQPIIQASVDTKSASLDPETPIGAPGFEPGPLLPRPSVSPHSATCATASTSTFLNVHAMTPVGLGTHDPLIKGQLSALTRSQGDPHPAEMAAESGTLIGTQRKQESP